MTILEGKWIVLFTSFEDTTALEDKKGLTIFSTKPVVDCTMVVSVGMSFLNINRKARIF